MNAKYDDSLIQALDECLVLMERGASLEQVLENYPLLAADLRPMLEAAEAAVNLVDSIQVPTGVQAHSRAAFLNAAQAQKRHKPFLGLNQPRKPRSQPRPFLFSLARAALILLMLFAIGSATVAGVSARSLPGDVLYPVKLIAEQTQLLFATNPQERIELEKSFDEERVQEIQNLTTYSRTTKVDFAGTLEPTGENGWQVSGVKLVIKEKPELQEYSESGLYLDIEGELQSDGSVQVTQLKPREYDMKGKIESLAPTEWVVSSVLIRLSDNTIITGSPKIGLEVEIKGYLSNDGSLQARQIKVKEHRSNVKTQEETQEEQGPEDKSLEPTRTPRPEKTRTQNEELQITSEPEKTEEPGVTKTEEHEEAPGPTETPDATPND